MPDGFAADRELKTALEARGASGEYVSWDDASADWDAFDAVIVRSTFDYSRRRDEFLAWADALDGRLRNPPAVLRWNSDKRYLSDLASAGLSVVPTIFVSPGDGQPPLEGEVVVKPTVSAGARDTGRFAPGAHNTARALLVDITRSGRVAMVQPYLPAVDEHGALAQDVGELTGDEHQRRLAALVDRGQIGLHHGHSPTLRYVNQQRARRVVGRGGEAAGVAPARRHRRLDDDLAVERREPVSGGDEGRGHDREAGGGELGEVALVAVPAQHGGRVAKAPAAGVGPSQELVTPARVVERRAHDDDVEFVPVGARVVPAHVLRPHSDRLQLRLQPPIRPESVGHRGTGGESDLQAGDATQADSVDASEEEGHMCSPPAPVQCPITILMSSPERESRIPYHRSHDDPTDGARRHRG